MFTLLHIVGWLSVAYWLYQSTRPGAKPVIYSALYINPLLVALGIQAGGGIINALQRPPETPDLFTPQLREAQRARSRVQELLERQGGNLDANLSAAGVTGSGGAGQRESLIRASTGAIADIDAQLADLVTQAGNNQRNLEFQQASSRFNNRQQAVSQLADAGTSLFSLSQLQGDPLPEQVAADSVVRSVDPLAQQVAQLNVDADGARTLPEGFSMNPLVPMVDPMTGRISFGG